MSEYELRAILDWWMCSDPFPSHVNKDVIDGWLLGECKKWGYGTITEAFHNHLAENGRG